MLSNYYEWIKTFHIVAMTSWMAGMFYLPRLYAYHAEVKVCSEQDKTFQVMESRLLRIIINPAMIASARAAVTWAPRNRIDSRPAEASIRSVAVSKS